jgi:hypothetical protein
MERRRMSSKPLYPILCSILIWCALFMSAPAHAQADSRAVFDRIRSDWAKLEGGFSYKARSFDRRLASAEMKRHDEGTGSRRLEIVRLTSINPVATEYELDVVVRGESLWYSRLRHGAEPEFFASDRDSVQRQDSQGHFINQSARKRSIDDSAIKQPMFVPERALATWASFPWPSIDELRDAEFAIAEGDFTSSSTTTTVSMRRKVNGALRDGPPAVRIITFTNHVDMGWLPTRIDYLDEDQQPYNQHDMKWGTIQSAVGPAVVPIEYTKRTWGRDPASGNRLPNTEEGYVIDKNSLTTRNRQTINDPRWAKVKLGSQPVQPSPSADSNEEPWPMSRIYALSFLGCVLAATALLYIRYRQMQAPSP